MCHPECDLTCDDCLYAQMKCEKRQEVCEYFYPVKPGQQEAIGIMEYRQELAEAKSRYGELLEILEAGGEP